MHNMRKTNICFCWSLYIGFIEPLASGYKASENLVMHFFDIMKRLACNLKTMTLPSVDSHY